MAGTKSIDPVYVEDDVTLHNSTIGPNVSIGSGAVIEDSEVSHTIVGGDTRISKSRLTNSLIGDSVVLKGLRGEVTVGDHSQISAGD